MFFDRFDIAEAHFLFLSEYHEGQWSDRYERLCKLLRKFRPRPTLNYETLTENGFEIYTRLVVKEREQLTASLERSKSS